MEVDCKFSPLTVQDVVMLTFTGAILCDDVTLTPLRRGLLLSLMDQLMLR
jgi:hypothetical protein